MPNNAQRVSVGDNAGLNAVEKFDNTTTDNVTNINGKSTDVKTEVDKDSRDDNARENAFDAVIIDADASDLRIDDNQNKDDKDEIGEVANFLPNLINTGRSVGGDGLDDEDIFDGTIEVVDETAAGLDATTNNPREGVGGVLTDVFREFVGQWIAVRIDAVHSVRDEFNLFRTDNAVAVEVVFEVIIRIDGRSFGLGG